MLNDSRWVKYLRREHEDFYLALQRQMVVCRQQRIRVDDKGRYETPKEKFMVSVNDGSWLIFRPRRKGGKRVHIRNMKKDYRKCIRSYASFLRADGIDNVDEMLYYILHYTFYHISFYRGLTITYDKTRPMIDEVVKWIMKKGISEVDKSEFIDPRKTAAPDEIYTKLGGICKARKSDKIRLVRQTLRKLTDKEIAEKYNPNLTNEENAAIIGIGTTRLKEWKKENADRFESIEDKVRRLYNPELSWTKNAEIIGYSVNTIKKYVKKQVEPIAVAVETPELETADSENLFTERLEIDNDELLTKDAEMITHSPDSIKMDIRTVDNENPLDEDDDEELISWLNDFKFEEEEEREDENTDSTDSIEHQAKEEEPIAIDIKTAELDAADDENQFTGGIDIGSDDFFRWMWGEEILKEIQEEAERERKRNALIYGTEEEVVKMVV